MSSWGIGNFWNKSCYVKHGPQYTKRGHNHAEHHTGGGCPQDFVVTYYVTT